MPTDDTVKTATLQVVHVVASLADSYGGVTRAVAGLAAIGSGVGISSSVLTLKAAPGDRNVVEDLQRGGVGVHEARPTPLLRRLHGSRELVSLLMRQRGADVVVAHSFFDLAALCAYACAKVLRKPLVIMPHGSLDPFDLQKHKRAKHLLRFLWRRVLRGSGAVWTTTEREAACLETFGAQLRFQVIGLPVGAAHRPLSERAETKDDGLTFLFLGRLDYKKGLPRLLEAAASALRLSDRLLIAGDGDPAYVRSIRDIVRERGLSDRVSFLGWLEGAEKAAVLNASDVFVLPSDNENFGVAVVEALQAGLPVLISDRVYLAEQLRAANAALVCEPSTSGLKTAMLELRDDPGLRRSLSLAGPRFVASNYANDVVATRMRKALDDVVASHSAGRSWRKKGAS